MWKQLSLLFALTAVSACAPTVWDRPGATQAQFSQDSAGCRLLARGMNSGDFYAQGSPGFVAGAAVGNAIGTAVNQAATFRDCMMAKGYTARAESASASGSAIEPDAVSPVGSVRAFAYDEMNGRYGFSSNELTEGAADAAALKGCASSTCKIVFRTGPKQCGAIAAAGDGKVWGGARRDREDAAEQAAIGNCEKRSGAGCKLRISRCNS